MEQRESFLRIALAQINPIVGDLEGNKEKIVDYIEKSKALGVDLIAFPEMALTGYPPEDLLLKPHFIKENVRYLKEIAQQTEKISAIIGFVDAEGDIFNAAALIHHKEIKGIYHKIYLPNYGVFDENRYFQGGREFFVFQLKGIRIGINICEDIWYPGEPLKLQTLLGGAEVIVNISSSPYHAGKSEFRKRMLSTRASDNAVIVAFVNLVGGQDELVFDGNSLIFDQEGNLIAEGAMFEEELLVEDLNIAGVFRHRLHDPRRRKEREKLSMGNHDLKMKFTELEGEHELPKPSLPPKKIRRKISGAEEVYKALILGVRDYVRKNGFIKVIIGLSGGIDSALTAAIAVDALGRDNVIGVTMPSRFSSEGTRTDAKVLAENLKIRLIEIPIQGIFEKFLEAFKEIFEGMPWDVTEENIQARIRGSLLMALSNKFHWLVLCTGNKSELSMGYCTLYGDMVGGFSVLKDVPKTMVYELAQYVNSMNQVIPQTIMERPPSAELREDQRDEDSLPPYKILDPILKAYVEEDRPVEEIVSMGFEEGIVMEVAKKVDRNEYKRRQGPIGIKITPRAFGKDRRVPITNRFLR